MRRWQRRVVSSEPGHDSAAVPTDDELAKTLDVKSPSSSPQLLAPTGCLELLPGFVYLPGVLPISSQQCLLDMACTVGQRSLAHESSGGWYRFQAGAPELNDGTKARFWDTIDCFPEHFKQLGESLAHLSGQCFPKTLATPAAAFQPRVGALNFYTSRGKMNWHRDDYNFAKRERPIVMASLGDAADFGYKMHESDPEKCVRLQSGDVIVFGGPARDLVHALLHVYPHTSPPELRFPHQPGQGRVSLTWRDVGPEDGLTFNSDERLGLVLTANTLPRYLPGRTSKGGRNGKVKGKGKGGDRKGKGK